MAQIRRRQRCPKCKNNINSTFVEKIGFALNNMGSFEKRPDGFAGEFFDLLFNSADIANFVPEDKIKYLNDMTTERDIHNQIEYARKEGIEKGREEERSSIAAKLKAQGFPIDTIAEATGLSKEQLEAL